MMDKNKTISDQIADRVSEHADRECLRAGLFIIGIFILSLSSIMWVKADNAPRKHESDFVSSWCDAAGGEQEYRLPDRTRVDCLLDHYAVEFDWSHKWAECIGQAAFYGAMTRRKSACVLIKYRTDTRAKFYRFAKRARTAAKRANVIVVCLSVKGNEVQCGEYQNKENIGGR